MSEAAQKETELVAGVIEGVTQKKPDTWQIQVKPAGSQYTKALWTKDSELVAALAQKIGQNGAFTCNVSHWTNNEGKPVRSLWIDSVGEADVAASPADGRAGVVPVSSPASVTPSIQSTHGSKPDVDWDAKERRDYRSRAWAQTLGAFQHTIKVDEDPVAVFQRLQPFQRKVFQDVCQSFAFPATDADENLPF